MLKQIGKFTISERIGRGTHSRVYRAVDPQGRSVAIKISTTQTESEHLAQFQKDLVAAASVLHPSLVAIHDLGFEDEFPYLVMELVEGRDLDRILKGARIALDASPSTRVFAEAGDNPSLGERIRIMQHVGEALQAAHERDVFHLDIRPSKIMVAAGGAVKVLDLGIGRLSYDPARLTEHGYLVGAPFYMSPERLTAIDLANVQCDVWSFGVTFYEWLSGQHPFYDDDGDRMIGNILDGHPAPLERLPAGLNRVILRSLEKDPSDRYSSISEMLADLKPLASDLKREESDALMAEALKQTDTGRWHEARRIARKLSDMDPRQAASSQMFGLSEEDAGPGSFASPAPRQAAPEARFEEAEAAELPAAPLPSQAASPAPEPAAPAAQISEPSPRVAAYTPDSPQPRTPRPQRPERTAPKIPTLGGGARNGGSAGASAGENGSPTRASFTPPSPAPEPVASGPARMTAAAPAVPVREEPKPSKPAAVSPAPEYPRPRPASSASATRPVPSAPQPTVRILETPEPSGFPWGKVSSFAAAALLLIGVLFFFLRSDSKFLRTADASGDARAVGPAGRVIKVPKSDQASVSSPTEITAGSQTTGNAGPASNSPVVLPGADPAAADPSVPAPKVFDPKTLSAAKLPVHRKAGPLVAMSAPPPSLNSAGEVSDSASLLPVGLPPPPAPAVKPPVTVSPSPAPVVPPPQQQAAPQTTQAAQAAAVRVGGSFSEPVLLHTVRPIYPPSALQRKAHGVVRFQATITKDGSVKNLQLLSGDPLLNVAAKQAVMQWKYRPAQLNGQPVEVTQAIVVNFNLSQ